MLPDPTPRYTILVLGGYGHYGGRICRALATEPGVMLRVGGRNPHAASALVEDLRTRGANADAVHIDHGASDLAARLRELAVDLVVHTSGPFQRQDFHVAEAAIEAGAHYVDLADGRDFVCGIGALDARARERGLVVTSGASTLPALSGAVLDRLAPLFARIDRIAIGIAPGQATPRGRATLEAVLSYCGRPFDEWSDGRWQRVIGWQGLHRVVYPALGRRWAARCDVPDLQLLPARYPGVRSVRFDAALELAASQFGLWSLAWLVRAGLVRRPGSHADAVLRIATWLDRYGSDVGGMQVRVEGLRAGGRAGFLEWQLVARRGHGPEIPCLPAVVIARKLAKREPLPAGAGPCLGLMTLDEFAAEARSFDIAWTTSEGTLP